MGRAGVLALVGNTPLVELQRLPGPESGRVLGKLEGRNPSGSVKDRAVLAILEDAAERGLLAPGGTIVEASAGNTALSLAVIGAALGYRVVQVINNDPKINIAARLRERGYRVTRIEGHGMEGPVEVSMLLVRRRGLRRVLRMIRWLAPRAFVTIERAERPIGSLASPEPGLLRFPWSPLFPLGGVRK